MLMKKLILILLVLTLSFSFNSCVVGQSTYVDYERVYFDRVVYGRVIADDYVWDGTYSYHVIGIIPRNVYWELWPCGTSVYLYQTNGVRIRQFEWTRRSIYYNRTHHNYYRFDDRHREPHHSYRQDPLPPRPRREVRTPNSPRPRVESKPRGGYGDGRVSRPNRTERPVHSGRR